MIKISAVIAAYKAKNFIYDCIQSMIMQTYPLHEILIAVDGCKDTTREILKYGGEKNIKIFWSENRVYPYVLKNSLLEHVSGDIILYFDVDDIAYHNLAEEIIGAYDEKTQIYMFNYHNGSNGEYIVIPAYGVFAATKRLAENTGFVNLKCGADTEFIERCKFNNVEVKELNKALFYRRIHGNNLTVHPDTNFESKYRNDVSMKKVNDNRVYFAKNGRIDLKVESATTNLIRLA